MKKITERMVSETMVSVKPYYKKTPTVQKLIP